MAGVSLLSPVFSWITWSVTIFVYGAFCEGLDIQPFQFPRDVQEGEDVQALCSIVGAKSEVKFKWFKDSSVIQSEKRWKILDHETFSVLVVQSPSVESSGNYSCVAQSSSEEDRYTTQLLVKDEVVVPVVEDARISLLEDGSLRILDTTQSDKGSYTCEVSNGIGNSLMKTIQLSVEGTMCLDIIHQYQYQYS
ncbi:transmembrane and immunoglobulin domain-containing protein 1-like [Limulus polyphemus]|uniref:Transmembrane and immunoglobulin domain-containing protein 1-like n=1 Tax=Limulus polyphemus TaxID=6850 RepID=A0ABM1SRB0_LIMPO|nr:transmembrane and immunoglobulin domain-containing protein 1-like [Limulus polyphemus]